MKKANVIILSGQSNAVGVGHAEYLPDHRKKLNRTADNMIALLISKVGFL